MLKGKIAQWCWTYSYALHWILVRGYMTKLTMSPMVVRVLVVHLNIDSILIHYLHWLSPLFVYPLKHNGYDRQSQQFMVLLSATTNNELMENCGNKELCLRIRIMSRHVKNIGQQWGSSAIGYSRSDRWRIKKNSWSYVNMHRWGCTGDHSWSELLVEVEVVAVSVYFDELEEFMVVLKIIHPWQKWYLLLWTLM